MNAYRTTFLVMALLVGVGCRHHTLTPTIGGRPAQTIKADARKADDGWVVTLPLPIGTWTPKPVGEVQAMEIITTDGKAAVRWKVPFERWANSDRPFNFLLVGPEDRNIEMSVTYTMFSKGTQGVLETLAHGWLPLPIPH